MAKAKRLTRKEIKAPDEFQTMSGRAIAWLMENRPLATWVGVGAVAAVFGVGGVYSYNLQKRADANADFGRALGMLDGQESAAVAALTGVAGTWGDTSVGRVALALATATDVRTGNADAALGRAAQALGEAAAVAPYFRQQVLLNWAAALEAKQSFKEAAEKYGQAAAEQGPYTRQALFSQARTSARAGDTEKARELYKQFAERFSDSTDVEFARQHAGA